MRGEVIAPAPLWAALLSAWRAGAPPAVLAARFHNSLAQLSLDVCRAIRTTSGCRVAALSGGVWQNRFLLERTVALLGKAGFEVLAHRQTPANDGCIALGQVLVAASQR